MKSHYQIALRVVIVVVLKHQTNVSNRYQTLVASLQIEHTQSIKARQAMVVNHYVWLVLLIA